MNALLLEMWHTWANGGLVMAAMALLALGMFTIAAQLLLTLSYRGLTKASDSLLRIWVVQPDRAPQRLAELIRYTQDEVHSTRDIEGRFREVEAAQVTDMDRQIAVLNVLVIAAPLFGLLGTVLGMLLTFKAIGVGGSSTSEVIARGISEALVATQTGMMVAVPGLIMATIAKRRRHQYVAFLARLEGVTLRHFGPELGSLTHNLPQKNADVFEENHASVQPAIA